MANKELVAEFSGSENRDRDIFPCPNFEDGQEFISESPGVVPEGFCAWAWTGIHKEILAIMAGGNIIPWMNREGTAIACCTDGLRPVVFKIERIEE
jgi:uncharacterized repeat protein (TIGR04076 family)